MGFTRRLHAPKHAQDSFVVNWLDATPTMNYIASRYMSESSSITLREYQALAQLRYLIRRFLAFSAEAAKTCDVEPQQHQLLLALKGLPPKRRPTIGVAAERLQLRHHSAVELVNRSIARGLVERSGSEEDHREVLLHITPYGERLLRRLSLAHRSELSSAAPELVEAVAEIVGIRKGRTASGKRARVSTQRSVQ